MELRQFLIRIYQIGFLITIVTRSLFKINLYAARGPRNQTGSFYTDCQRNATTQTHVSL